jgi:hypothetical protein
MRKKFLRRWATGAWESWRLAERVRALKTRRSDFTGRGPLPEEEMCDI